MLLTKHCSPKAREWMLKGHFKIGSHEEYSQGLATGTLSDTAEGKGGFSVMGNLFSFSGNIGGGKFDNISIVGFPTAIAYENSINSMMFCASKGKYDSERHATIINGASDQQYEPNADYTAYLILDGSKLMAALTAATDQFFGTSTRWSGGTVQYGERYEDMEASRFKGVSSPELMVRLIRQASLKPKKFAVEAEYRFLMDILPGRPLPKSIFTKDLSVRVQKAFRRAIVDQGDVRSPV